MKSTPLCVKKRKTNVETEMSHLQIGIAFLQIWTEAIQKVDCENEIKVK